MRAIHDTEFPNSVEATQKLLDEQGTEYQRLKVIIHFWKCDLLLENFVFFF